MNNPKFGALQPILGSSINPEKLSLTIKGLIPLILIATVYFKVDVSENELMTIVEQSGMVITGIMTVWGIIRKFLPKRI